ncbi:MAG: transporter substrate-binding domain-containing protein [Synergistaceae bacterium]|nr:transporter substrate-binding domain-containing protein [Synergistaceae bacterium]
MKKIIFASVIAVFMASCVFASVVMTARVGFLTRLNTTEEEFSRIIQNSERVTGWNLLSNRHELYGVKFYDSLNTMIMALDKGEIDEIALPNVVADYITRTNPQYEICCMALTRLPMSLAFGFTKDKTELLWKFNRVIQEMEDDWTLPEIQGTYIYASGKVKPVEFTKFEGAETIKAAVTGDLPPIDYVDAGGNPSGFNTALLAEIGRRLKMNIEIVHIDAGARNAALSSGRVDLVFWYETAENGAWNLDAPEGVILSRPYYSWNKFFHIRKK